MARARKVDADTALMNAIGLFWREGFEPVGTRQIENETGITRFTLQNVHGGKMGLYLEALDAYLTSFEANMAPGADIADLEELAAWLFRRLNPPMPDDFSTNGCLLLNALIEFKQTNPEINQRATRYFSLLTGRFEAALSKMRSKGIVPNGFDVARNAELLTAIVLGINVAICAAQDNMAARPMVEAGAAMIRSWGSPDKSPA